jgi:hypothetical protein
MRNLLRTTIVIGAAGCLLLAASYWLPGMRPGDVVGANIGSGAIFGLGLLVSAAGVGLGVYCAFTHPMARWSFITASVGIAVVALAVLLVGAAAYV